MEIMTKNACVVDECGIVLCDRPLRYRLLRCERGYVIEVRYDGERAAAFAGADLLRAASAYQKIVRGAVTPCTLDDVLADLFAEAADE